jgi:hypothetical protein
MIWTHNFQNLTYHDTFVPSNAPSTEVYQGGTTIPRLLLGHSFTFNFI